MALIIGGSSGESGQSSQGAAVIRDGDTRSFAADVIDASLRVPVIVDFWAPWCGPCKQLTPLLEKLVRQAAGLVRLVKINIDTNQDLAAQLRIQSVPTVYAFVGGQPVDAFVGAQPESKLRAFIDRLTQGATLPVEDALQRGQDALDAGDAKTAARIFSQVLQEDRTHPKAIAGLVRARVAAGEIAEARKLIAGLPRDLAANADITAAHAAIELAEESSKAGNAGQLQKAVEAAPNDHQKRFDLALALHAAGQSDGALEQLLEIVRRDPGWNEEAARKHMVKVFDALGSTHPLTTAYRRRLSSVLFS
jgi:putative thioredoxin